MVAGELKVADADQGTSWTDKQQNPLGADHEHSWGTDSGILSLLCSTLCTRSVPIFVVVVVVLSKNDPSSHRQVKAEGDGPVRRRVTGEGSWDRRSSAVGYLLLSLQNQGLNQRAPSPPHTQDQLGSINGFREDQLMAIAFRCYDSVRTDKTQRTHLYFVDCGGAMQMFTPMSWFRTMLGRSGPRDHFNLINLHFHFIRFYLRWFQLIFTVMLELVGMWSNSWLPYSIKHYV